MDVEVQSIPIEPPVRRRVFTFQPGGPLWWYVTRMALAAFLGGALTAIVAQFFFEAGDQREELLQDNYLLAVFAMVVVAPPLETLFMALFFGIATFFSGNVHRLALVSTICWAVLHVANSPVNAFGVLWPFYVMSRVYLAWRPIGFWKAVGVTTLTHAGINGLAVLLYGLAISFAGAVPPDTSPTEDPVQYTV